MLSINETKLDRNLYQSLSSNEKATKFSSNRGLLPLYRQVKYGLNSGYIVFLVPFCVLLGLSQERLMYGSPYNYYKQDWKLEQKVKINVNT